LVILITTGSCSWSCQPVRDLVALHLVVGLGGRHYI